MLEQNPLYLIYKNGKIPVIRFKNEGFINYNQNSYFENNEKYKDVNGCFVILGGLQDSFILSGVKDIDILNIGYIEPDTKVLRPGIGWMKAEDVFEKALIEYNKIKSEENEYEFLDDYDDFDLIYTQAIVDANDVKGVKIYDLEERKNLIHTVDDGFFRIGDFGNYEYVFKMTNSLDEYLKIADERKCLNKVLNAFKYHIPTEWMQIPVIEKFRMLDAQNDENLFASENRELIMKNAPRTSTESLDKLNLLEDVIKNKHESTGYSFSDYKTNIEIEYQGKISEYSAYLKNGKIELGDNNSIDLMSDTDIVCNPETVEKILRKMDGLKNIGRIDKNVTINNNQYNIFKALSSFYKNTNANLIKTDDGFKYTKGDFTIEYNFKLDDCVINYNHPNYEEKLLHEEDLILVTPYAYKYLEPVYDFRYCFEQNKEKVEEFCI